MKTNCMSCGGPTKKMQTGGLPKAQKGVMVKSIIKPKLLNPTKSRGNGPVQTIKKVIKKLKPRKTNTGCFGVGCTKMQNGGTTNPSQNQIDKNKIKKTISTRSGGTRSKEITRDQNLYDPSKNSGAVTKTKRNAAGEIIKQKTRIISNAKAQKKYSKILNNTNKKSKTCFSGSCMQNGGTVDPSQNQIDRNKIKQTGSTWRGGTRSKEVTLDQNLYDPSKNSGAVTRTKRNAAGEIIKQKTRIVSNAKAQKKYNKIFNSTNRQTKTCFSGSCT